MKRWNGFVLAKYAKIRWQLWSRWAANAREQTGVRFSMWRLPKWPNVVLSESKQTPDASQVILKWSSMGRRSSYPRLPLNLFYMRFGETGCRCKVQAPGFKRLKLWLNAGCDLRGNSQIRNECTSDWFSSVTAITEFEDIYQTFASKFLFKHFYSRWLFF